MEDVKKGRTVPVPRHLRDTHYAGAAKLGHGMDYQYPHDHEGRFVKQEYLGVDKIYYKPTDRGLEAELARRLEELRRLSRGSEKDDPNSEAEGVSND
jgi:putative ATPase